MEDWQPQITSSNLASETLSYSSGRDGLVNSIYSQDSYLPSDSRVPSMISDNLGSTSESPSQASISSASPILSHGLCPLVTGQTKECIPEYCGIDAPCLAGVTQFPEIEESDLTPCVQRSYLVESPINIDGQQASANNKKMKVESCESSPRDRRENKRTASSRAPSSGPKSEEIGRSKGRQAHSLVERKYRENLNAKIEELHDALRKVRTGSMVNGTFSRPAQPFGSANRARKGDILGEALNYIYQSQVDMRHMAEEIGRLKGELATAEEPPNKCQDCNIRKQVKSLRILADAAD